jgi:Ran-binding protein 3
MAPERDDNARLSDTEGGEKPVREKLQKAHITQDQNTSTSDTMAGNDSGEEAANGNESLKVQAQPRGQLQKKRSYEEIEGEHVKESASEPAKHHTRKRSRDSTADEDQLNNGRRKVSGERTRNGDSAAEIDMGHQAEPDSTSKTPRAMTPEPAAESRTEPTIEDMSSPKTKRSRLLSDTSAVETDETVSNGFQPSTSTKPESTTKIPATSGFANASATSPFGALAKSKSPEPQTSASAFAASGFSALSGSSASGFGSVAKSGSGFGSGGTFATGAKSALSAKENETPKPAGFGGALGQPSGLSGAGSSTSAFGSGASGFGRIGSPSGGFGSTLGGAGFGSLSGGLSSFASGGKAPAPLGGTSKAAKSFGAPTAEEDDDEGEDGDDDDKTGTKSPLAAEEDKQDERFYAQSLETGEEDETTDFNSRAKLYNFAANADGKKEWRERGLGVLRLNVKHVSSDGEEKVKARLLMRADGSHRVVLNTPIMKDMKFGTLTGGPPQGGYMLFMGTIEGSSGLELLQVKVSSDVLIRAVRASLLTISQMRQQNCMDLYEKVAELQENM